MYMCICRAAWYNSEHDYFDDADDEVDENYDNVKSRFKIMRIMVVVIIACFNHLLVHLTSSSGFRFFKERIILAHIHPFTFELHPFLCNNKPENQEEWLNTFILSVSNCTSFCNKDHNFPVYSEHSPKSLFLRPLLRMLVSGRLWAK